MMLSSESDDSARNSKNVITWLPWLVLGTSFAVFAGRWIWIAGIGDYGWNHELGMRIWQGDVPYRDYVSALPQLTSYSIIPFLWLGDGNLWANQIHLYAWWLGCLIVGLCVLRKLGSSVVDQSSAVFAAACLSSPAMSLGHAYSYAGTFFFGLTLLSVLSARDNSNPTGFFFAGFCAGLGIFAKQNIGLISIVCGVLGVLCVAKDPRNYRLMVSRLASLSGGIIVTVLPIFLYFAFQAGAQEVFAQMFRDAGAGKGGVRGIFISVMPFIFLTPPTPHRNFWVVTIAAVTSVIFLLLIGRRMLSARLKQGNSPEISQPSWLLPALVGVSVISFVSLVSLTELRKLLDSLCTKIFYPTQAYIGVLLSLIYTAILVFSVICLVRFWRNKESHLWLPIIALPLIVCGQEMSSQIYLPYSAAVGVPLAIFLLRKYKVLCNVPRFASVTGAMVVLVHICFPAALFVPAFEKIERLPDHTRFAGLYSSSAYAERVRQILENVTPRIQGKRTLWLCFDGLHLAYGGKSVYSVALLNLDTYNARSESAMKRNWERNPPEFVFLGYYRPARGSTQMAPDAVNQWLPESYRKVWESKDLAISLWQFRHAEGAQQ